MALFLGLNQAVRVHDKAPTGISELVALQLINAGGCVEGKRPECADIAQKQMNSSGHEEVSRSGDARCTT